MKPVVILESDPFADATLTELLRREGLDVMDVRSESSLLQLLEQVDVGAVFVDCESPDWTARSIFLGVETTSPQTLVVLTAASADLEGVREAMNAGASELLVSPYDPDEVRQLLLRVGPLLRGEGHMQRESLHHSTGAFPHASMPAPQIAEIADAQPLALREALERFLQTSFQTFVGLERQVLTMKQAEVRSRDATAGVRRSLRTWIVHPDPRFARGVAAIADRLELTVSHVMTAGGEVLDRLGSSRADLLLISDALPDIPVEMVVESARTNDSGLAVILIRGWDTPSRSADLLGAGDERHSMEMKGVDDLIDIIEMARSHCLAADLGREFAQEFRQRHHAFLRDYTLLRKWLAGEA